MNKALLLTLCASLIAAPARAEQLTFSIKGQFTDQGPLAHGRFEGSFSYDSETPDRNPHVLNVGVFEVSDLTITVYDAQSAVVDELNHHNSVGTVVLTIPLSGPNHYRLLAHPHNTILDGQISIGFDFPEVAKPDVAPQTIPRQFTDGKYILPMPFPQQAIASATITAIDAPIVSHKELPLMSWLVIGGMAADWFVGTCFQVARKRI